MSLITLLCYRHIRLPSSVVVDTPNIPAIVENADVPAEVADENQDNVVDGGVADNVQGNGGVVAHNGLDNGGVVARNDVQLMGGEESRYPRREFPVHGFS